MSENPQSSCTVADFRQTLLWPLQLVRAADTAQLHYPWRQLAHMGAACPWQPIADEFSSEAAQLSEARYQEFVTFMPFARRFLYGEGKPGKLAAGVADSPIHIFGRNDVRSVRITLEDTPSPITLRVSHMELYFFYDVDLALLSVAIAAQELPLDQAMEVMFRLGRTYPSYWDSDGDGGHCARKVEWLDAEGQVLSASDYEDRARYLQQAKSYRVPCVSRHWEFLMAPLVLHDSAEKGSLRFREIEYPRMPLMACLSFHDVRRLTRGDMIRLGLATRPWQSHSLPYTEAFLKDFEQNHCYDRYWEENPSDPWSNTRFICAGQNFVVIGSEQHRFFRDEKVGIRSHFMNQYFLLFLIAHFQKAALLMLSDRMVQAITRLNITDPDSIKAFRLSIRHTMEVFLRFTHRYWFQSVSDQVVARDLFRRMHDQIHSAELFEQTRQRIMDMAHYLEGDEIKRQSDTVVRLTVVTILGLIGTMTSGILGMNLFDLTENSALRKLGIFFMTFVPIAALTFYTVLKSRRLSQFLDGLSDERLGIEKKWHLLRNVWRTGKHRKSALGDDSSLH